MEQNLHFNRFCRITEPPMKKRKLKRIFTIGCVCCGMQFMTDARAAMHDSLCNTFILVKLTKIINTNARIKTQKAITGPTVTP